MQKVLLADLQIVAQDVVAKLRSKQTATLIALRGELGAGKTTFVQALGKELGVVETMQSPTYVLMKKYSISHPNFKTLVHIDAYRLEKPEEFAALDPQSFLGDPQNLVVVEWPEKLGEQLPKPDLALNFSSDGASEGERYIEVDNG